MKITIDELYVLVGKDMNGLPTIYSRIFTSKSEADELAKKFSMTVNPAFISNK